MADTSQHEELSEPHTNGVMDGLTEEEKSKMRPADIDADMREMERRKRVEMMMNSRLFREELERIIETQMKDGSGPSGLLQQISEMMGAQGARFNSNVFKNSNCVVPINDIRGVESMGYAKGEKILRCKLAAVFRLLDLYGWTQGVGGQITARLNQDQEHFLVNPYGLLYHEVTASSLVKVDMKATVVEQGTTNFGVHVTGFQLHSTIHAARPDIKCIIHITTPTVTAVSSLKSGLLPLGQESIVIGEVSSHRYMGESVLEPEEREKITRNLGPINKVMLLTNRGALCCGETVEEAFYNVYNTVLACETQLKLMPVGLENLSLISDEEKKAIYEASRKGLGVAASGTAASAAAVEPSPLAEKLEKRWRIGGTEFEALMRMLDNAGFRTGYIYRHPLVKGEPPRPRNDVEVPPAVSSLGYLLEEEELYKQGLWKGGRKGTDRSRWLNSPNVYQKIEIQETGTQDPKKITKWVDQSAEEWVSDGSPTHSSTPVKIDGALQFVPKNTNPKEFKQLQQQIKDYRRADKISAGPQSHILEGVSWEEAKKMQDATISGTGEQVVLVGAASKGIIQRGFQHNAMVYKTPYAKNPFDAVTDQELDQYKKEVERKHKGGDPYDESQSESEALSSFNVSRATHESSTAKSPVQSPISVTSETEEESRDEPRVLRIETKQVPVPSQPEMVLSDAVASTQFVEKLPTSFQVPRNSVRDELTAQDATNQFLNEMRRSAIESRNDHTSHRRGENTVNGDHSDAHHSTFSQSSKEDVSVSEESPKKEKKKKKGLRTPSFLKKKKEKKKPIEA
ncbi:protein hu-li tai shao isoform X2 [Venturia canescens]|uniref:protein hu-li tai shao isoform X2 n=1 Tax=Venturia canescens TaxID=32260 RepID=UPI001C9D55DB|nr:protein hu-li tai shao isoform X2 [Venturia canescens]